MAEETVGEPGYDLVNPVPRPRSGPFTVTTRPERRQVVLLDNGKPNSMAILRRAQVELRARGIDVKEEIRSKPFAGVPLDDELLSLLSQERGLVLCGVHD
jgi:hypothetical protein